MKQCSPATLAILAGGEYIKIEFWKLVLLNGTTYYFTTGEQPLLIGGNLYVGGLVFVRDQITQKAGLEVNSLDLTIEPQLDYPGGQPLIEGGTFMSQLTAGVLDGCQWLMSKGFFMMPGSNPVTANGYTYTPPPAGSQIDTSPGIVPWWGGITSKVMAGRFSADITLDESTSILANQQMPRNMIQAGCVHRLFDVACGINKGQNIYNGSVIGSISGNSAASSLAPASFSNGYFNLGIITFTSGVLNGASFTVSTSLSSSGVMMITTVRPFPNAPAVGDTYNIVPGCDKTMTMCKSGKFILPSGAHGSNLAHYRGCPFVPQPETLYDGGTGSQTLTSIGSQGKPSPGSTYSGKLR